jgi:hypothetical protein
MLALNAFHFSTLKLQKYIYIYVRCKSFFFFLETGSHYVAQIGLELSDPPASAFQVLELHLYTAVLSCGALYSYFITVMDDSWAEEQLALSTSSLSQ